MSVIDVSAAALCRAGQVLALRRSADQSLAGHWEFPGGKREPFENHWQCLRRELSEELSIEIATGDFVGRHSHQYPDKIISLCLYAVTQWRGDITLSVHDEMRWLAPDQLDTLEWAPADVAHLEALRRRLQRR